MQVNAAGEIGEGLGAALPDGAEKFLHIVPGGQAELAGELAVDGVLHHHIHHLTAVVHHDLQLPGHVGLPVVDAGHGAPQSGALPGKQVPPGGGGDLRPPCPQQGHIPHNDLPADVKLPGQGGGADRPAGLLQTGQDGGAAGGGVHIHSPLHLL